MRILVVEDFARFRQLIRSMLAERPHWQIVAEVSDGLEAVQQAAKLKPDLALLDIGLPTLNGIEAARHIRKLSPESKILFLSQENSPEVVREALNSGASGYVAKTRAASDLLAAVEAVGDGRQFVSSGLSGGSVVHATDWQARPKEALLSLVPRKAQMARTHEVQFSSDDASLLSGFARFIEAALKAGNPAIVIATESHRNSLFARLQTLGLNIGAAIEQGIYIPLDVDDTLSAFMVNDLPDSVRFQKVADDLLVAASKAAKGECSRVAACGECAPTLWAQGKAHAAIRVERLWDEVARTYDVDILCGYLMKSAQREQESDPYQRICAEHSVVCSR